jgi:hypothetical protein
VKKLNRQAFETLRLLVNDLQKHGPAPGRGCPNYGKLKGTRKQDLRHCHLIKGKPTYVCCWKVINKQAQIIEGYYVGTHEKAPY